MKLLTAAHANAKTAKNSSQGNYLSYILHLAPYKLSGKNVCPMASRGCAAACLNTAGRGRFDSIQKAVKECNKIIAYYSKINGGLSGFSAHVKPGTYGGVKVNGSANSGACEDFILREHFSQNESFNFCKTRQYAYDTVVTACLIVLKQRLGDLIDVSSDGRKDEWTDGLSLVNEVLGSFSIPNSIQ